MPELHTEMDLAFDGECMILRKRLTGKAFAEDRKALGHEVKKIPLCDGQKLCFVMCADFTKQTLTVENFSADTVKTAFGNQKNPGEREFQCFLESRCVAREGGGLQYYLWELQIDECDPMAMIRKTEGGMAEDHQWLRIEDADSSQSEQ